MPRTAVLPGITLDMHSKQSLQSQLVLALQRAIRQGSLKPGVQLPPSREAAAQLGIGRNTVVDAYAELLADGLIETRGRHGSFVAAHVHTRPPLPTVVQTLPPILKRLMPSASAPTLGQDWRVGQANAQLLPLPVWRSASKEAGRHLPPGGYGDPRGHAGLRLAIRNWLFKERAVAYDIDQIVITQGTGMALDLLMQVLLQPGDVCAIEVPGYPRAKSAMLQYKASIREVAVDDHGMLIAHAFTPTAPALLHLTPSHQYPLGGRLSGERRQQLIRLVTQHGSLLIENEYDHEYIHEGQNHVPLAASLPAHTALVSTFAKAVSPALRLGFIAAPPLLAQALASRIDTDRLHVSWPVQCSMQWLLQSGELQKHMRRVRRHYAQLRKHLMLSLRQLCPALQIKGQRGGLHLVLSCARPSTTDRLVEQLKQSGILLQTLQEFGSPSHGFLLGYGHMSFEDVDNAVSVLRNTLSDVSVSE